MRHLPSIYKFCYYNRYIPEISCTLLLLMELQLWLVAKNGFIALRKNDKLLLQIISYQGNMLRRSQPQNSSIYAHFVHTDNNCTLLSEHHYGNTGCSNNSSRMSKPSTPIWYHTRKSGGSDRLNTATFYEPDWQSYNISGVQEQGCWFPTWPFIVYRYDLSCWFQPIIWTLRVTLPRYRTNWEHYTWQQLLLINPQTLFSLYIHISFHKWQNSFCTLKSL